MKPTILVTGAKGQLGSEFRVIAPAYPAFHFLFTGREALSIENTDAVEAYFKNNNIAYCINCAAYTAVDRAESETAAALLINANGAANLAEASKKYGASFFHISTDYVFDGTASTPYKEDHATGPVGSYGISKLQGEEMVLEHNRDAIIIRTSWVYSAFGNNFVKTMLRLMKERESINVVSDQVGRPTYAADLATAILKIISRSRDKKLISGIYHFSNTGSPISWYDFAMAIKEISGSTCRVNPIPTSAYPAPAKRPGYSVLDTGKMEQTFKLDIPVWKESLEACLKLLQLN